MFFGIFIKVFDLSVGSTGLNERILKLKGIEYLECVTHNSSHAGYYPGAFTMAVKLLFCPKNGRILGGQVVGADGVDKRLDLLAVAIR
jgi:NADPH-dependent 2,4-dienoyl-CoA reductase/sulfur reductase-like enzyme